MGEEDNVETQEETEVQPEEKKEETETPAVEAPAE